MARSTRHAGYLDGFDLSREDAEAIIMAARVKAGWIEAPTEEPDDRSRRGGRGLSGAVAVKAAAEGWSGAELRRHAHREAPDDLIRFVVGPDGVLVPDLRRKLPGRGVWAS